MKEASGTTTALGRKDGEPGDAIVPKVHVASGYLTKMGGVRHNWLRRWFVLDAQQLTYFDSEAEENSLGAVELAIVAKVRASSARDSTEEEIELVTKERTYRLRASTASERDMWLASLGDAVKAGANPEPGGSAEALRGLPAPGRPVVVSPVQIPGHWLHSTQHDES